jgi:FG-GAP-like repeat/Tyrosine-protein kinase ephrin type A/B receptor-like
VNVGSFSDISWCENVGGVLTTQHDIDTNAHYALTAHPADLDGDGDVDLVVTSGVGSYVTWYENTGGGSFSPSQSLTDYSTQEAWINFAVAVDMDGDSDLDIVYSASFKDHVSWIENLGDTGNGLKFASRQVIEAALLGSSGLAISDYDLDGDLDIAVSSYTENSISLYQNKAGNTFSSFNIIDTNAGLRDRKITVGVAVDVNHDGFVDLITAEGEWGKVSVRLNHGRYPPSTTDRFADVQNVAEYANWDRVHIDMHMGDFNDDSHVDIAVAVLGTEVVWFENDGTGDFGTKHIISDTTDSFRAVVAGNFDNDTYTDIAVGTPTSVLWYRNNGDGSFSGKQILDSTNGVWAKSLYVLDINNDGLDDILIGTASGTTIKYYINVSNGKFSDALTLEADANVGARGSVEVVDLNGDERADILSVADPSGVVWFENLGNGTFGPLQWITDSGEALRSVFAADMDGDGFMDVLTADYGRGVEGATVYISWHRNMRDGTFGGRQIMTGDVTCNIPEWVHAADVDSDGDLDVLSACYRKSSDDHPLVWVENKLVHAVHLDVIAGAPAVGDCSVLRNAPCHSISNAAVAQSSLSASAVVIHVGAGTHTYDTVQNIRLGHRPTRIDIASPGATLSFEQQSSTPRMAVLNAASSVRFTVPSTLSESHFITGGSLVIDNRDWVQSRALRIDTQFESGAARSPSPSLKVSSTLRIQNSHSLFGDGGAVAVGGLTYIHFSEIVIHNASAIGSPSSSSTTSAGSGSGGCMAVSDQAKVTIDSLSLSMCRSASNGGSILVSDQLSTLEVGTLLANNSISSTGCGGLLALMNTPGSGAVIRNARWRDVSSSTGVGNVVCADTGVVSILSCATTPAAYITSGSDPSASLFHSTNLGFISLNDTCITQTGAAASSIASCRFGTVSSSTGGLLCSDCVPGQFRNTSLTTCAECQSGTFSVEFGATVCANCTSGTVSTRLASVSCSACPAGRYATASLAATACRKCDIGRFTASDGATTCNYCETGSSTSQTGAVQCTSCPAGEFQNATTLQCEQCKPGYFTNTTRAARCMACPVGSVSSLFGQVTCTRCPAGRYATSTVAATSCKECNAGTITAIGGQTECTPCVAGSSTSRMGSVQCFACAPGQYQNVTTKLCEPCSSGTFTNTTSQTRCTACRPGTFSSIVGSVGCVPCASGTFSDVSALSECTPCPVHSFSSRPGQLQCTSCVAQGPYRYADRLGSQFCDECDVRSYLIFPNRSDPTTFRNCAPCPPNVDCSAGRPVATEKHWVDINAITGIVSVFECSNPDACTGPRREGNALAENVCGENRLPSAENPLCAQCSAGFQELGSKCVECTSTDIATTSLLFALVFVFVFIFYFLSQGGSAYVSVASYYIQMVLLFVGSQTYSGAASLLALANFDISSTSGNESCFVRMSEEERVLAGMIGPLAAFGSWVLVALLFYCQILYRRTVSKRKKQRQQQQTGNVSESVPSYCDDSKGSPGASQHDVTVNDNCSEVEMTPMASPCAVGEQSESEPQSSGLPVPTVSDSVTVSAESKVDTRADHHNNNAQVSEGQSRFVNPILSCLLSTQHAYNHPLACTCNAAAREAIKQPHAIDGDGDGDDSKHREGGYDGYDPSAIIPRMVIARKAAVTVGVRLLRTLLALFLLTFNGMMSTALAVFNCIDITFNGHEYSVIQAFPTVSCTGSVYSQLAALAGITLVVYLAIPIGLLLVYGSRLYHVSQLDALDAQRKYVQSHIGAHTYYILGAFTFPFRTHVGFWKVFVLFRRFLLVLFVVLLSDRSWRMAIASILNVTVLLSHVAVQPYINTIDNVMETFSLFILSIIGVILVQISPPYSSSERTVLTVLWVLPFMILLAWGVTGWVLSRPGIRAALGRHRASRLQDITSSDGPEPQHALAIRSEPDSDNDSVELSCDDLSRRPEAAASPNDIQLKVGMIAAARSDSHHHVVEVSMSGSDECSGRIGNDEKHDQLRDSISESHSSTPPYSARSSSGQDRQSVDSVPMQQVDDIMLVADEECPSMSNLLRYRASERNIPKSSSDPTVDMSNVAVGPGPDPGPGPAALHEAHPE